MFPSSLFKQPFVPDGASSASRSLRRRKLWELPTHAHCPVVGVCLPFAALRRLAAKVSPETASFDDYALHSSAVQLSRSRNKLAEAIQDELELRHATIIKLVRKQRDRGELEITWAKAISAGEIAGALWAILTHPLCDALFAEAISQKMHMLQHQAGASLRLDIAHYHLLQEENASLARTLAGAQQRCERNTQEKTAALEALQTRFVQLRGELILRDSELAELRARLDELQVLQGELNTRRRLEHQLLYQEERNVQLCLENARLRKALERVEGRVIEAIPVREETASGTSRLSCADASLEGHRILCVGGREASVQVYRKLVEEAGGEFLHHDGGIEDRFGRLDSALGAADLVICQTGCISHNAYWRVKDHCKRTGKRCAFVENPSGSGLARGLQHLLADTPAEPETENRNPSAGMAMLAGYQQS
jgi:hypothetical protein